MTDKKRVVCLTEWEVTREDGARMVDMRTTCVPNGVARVADEMREPKRPEPLTADDAWDIFYRTRGNSRVSMATVLDIERNRQAEIAAWDAEHGVKSEPSDAPVWVEAPQRYPEDGWYWYKTQFGPVGINLEIGGDYVARAVTHISGPIQLKQPVDQ